MPKNKKQKKTPKPPPSEEPTRGGDTRREGKKSISWKEDPEILTRLVKVASMMNQNKRPFEIARETSVSIPTAKLDISRVREMWREDAKDRLKDAQATAIAQYASVINQAWEDIKKVNPTNPARAAFQNVILRAQKQMDTVSGIAEKVEHTGAGGGPIEHSIVDTEKIRRKRWEQIAPGLQTMKKKETDANSNAAQKPN